VQRIAGDDAAFERQLFQSSSAPRLSLRPGALREASAMRASAAKALTICSGVAALPRS
jgi:hypothetical protein